jgi:hypothetical protein
MGFYDTTCMVTGINNSPGEATVVLLVMTENRYRPISLGISGSYDGYGCIDKIQLDNNTAMACEFFSKAHRAGRFDARDQTSADAPELFDPDIDIDALLYLVERTTSCFSAFDAGGWGYPPSPVLDGNPVVFAMIAQPVWDELAADPDLTCARDAAFASAFEPEPGVAAEIYGQRLFEIDIEVRRFAAIADFIRRQPALRWAPGGEPEQRYARDRGMQFSEAEIDTFVAQARNDYRDEPAVQAALDTYCRLVEEFR